MPTAMPLQVSPTEKMPKATFSQPYITIYVYEKDYLIPKLCMTRTFNLSSTQLGYQLVILLYTYMVVYGWLKVAFGIFCQAKLAVASFALAKLAVSIFCLGKTCRGGIF